MIAFLFTALVIGVICYLWGYSQKKSEIEEINRSNLRKYRSEEEIARKELQELKNQKDEEEKKISHLRIDFQNTYDMREEALEKALKEREERRRNEITTKIKLLDNQLSEDYNNRKEEIEKELTKIQEELQKHYKARQAIIEEQIREEEKRSKLDFYRITLKQIEKEDIESLKAITPRLHNKEILSKLIWSTYYQKPYKDLVNRVVGTEKVCGIYKISNLQSGRAYIGQSTDIATRWANHLKTSLGIDACAHSQIHDALGAEGVDNFTFEVIEAVPREQLNEKEKYYINFYDTNHWGYNVTKGNGGN